MTTSNLTAATVSNRIVWKNDTKSMRTAFKTLDKYKSKVSAIKSQMNSVGKIKLQVEGLAKARSQMKSLRNTVNNSNTQATSRVKPVTSRVSAVGPQRPPVQKEVARGLELQRSKNEAAKMEARIVKFSLTPAMQKLTNVERAGYVTQLKSVKSARALGIEMARVQSQVRVLNTRQAQNLAIMNKQGFAAQRMVGSVKQLAGGYLSIYTLLGGIGSVAKTGMDFQKIESSMLSVSSNAQEAKDNLKFVTDESLRLGGSLVQNAKAFTKLLASKGEMSLDDVKSIYTGMSELAATRGLSADEVSGAINALNQMAGKTKVQAEELRQQLAERIPGAVELFAKAAKDAGLTTHGTVAELEKLMRDGKALAKDILPKAAIAMHKSAIKNGALAKAVKNFNIVLQVAGTNLQLFQNSLWGRGVQQGLAYLLNGFNDLMKSANTLSSFLGGLADGVMTGLVFPFRLAYAAIYDVTKLLGMQEWDSFQDGLKGTVKWAAFAVATFTSLAATLWGIKKLFGGMKWLRKSLLPAALGGGSGSSKGSSKGGILGIQKVWVVNMPKTGLSRPAGTATTAAGTAAGTATSAGGKFAKLGKFAMIGGIYGLIALAVGGIVIGLSEAVKAMAGPVVDKNNFAAQKFGTKNPKEFSYTNQRYGIIPINYTAPAQQPQKVEVEITSDTDLFNYKVKSIASDEISYQSWSR